MRDDFICNSWIFKGTPGLTREFGCTGYRNGLVPLNDSKLAVRLPWESRKMRMTIALLGVDDAYALVARRCCRLGITDTRNRNERPILDELTEHLSLRF